MKGEQRGEPQEPRKLTLAEHDLLDGRWRGAIFYTMASMRQRYGPDYGRPVYRERRDEH